jgi:hypothetical protein
MSRGSGAMARWVIDAEEPSMKNSTAENSPTPRVIPARVARLLLGLRTRSRQTYLAIM